MRKFIRRFESARVGVGSVILCMLIAFLWCSPTLLLNAVDVIAQEQTAKNAPKPSATPAPKIEEKNPPVIIEKSKLNELTIAEQRTQLAFNAIIIAAQPELVTAWKDAQKKQEEEYVKVLGFPSRDLQNWDITSGVDGALILRRKVQQATAPPVPVKAEEKK